MITKRMNPEIKTLWLERLRSGQIEQGEGVLATPDGKRCCLGVLCDVAVEQGVLDTPTVHTIAGSDKSARLVYGRSMPERRGSETALPPAVLAWAGIDDDDLSGDPGMPVPNRENDMNYATLSELNDHGLTFPQIADVIEWAM